jgi:glyoxylase-like metal-dependent hydrolase (beta-lactamase superfamily II)
MTTSIHIGIILCMLMSGLGGNSAEFVKVERLSDRVVIAYWIGTGRTNIVTIESKKGLAIIDTEMSPRIMAPIKESLERALGRNDWIYVINTHAHMHHASGNCLFKGASVVGHDNLPDEMKWLVDKVTNEKRKRMELNNSARTIRGLQSLLPQVTGNRMQTRHIQGEIEFYRLYARDIEEGFEVVKPTITFPDRHTLDLGDLKLELIFFGKGHSHCDILIYIPQERILVTGAIVYQRGHLPGISERTELKDLHRYIAVLNEFLKEDVKLDYVIASHSPPLKRNDLKYVRDYYQAMLDGISKARREGMTLEQAKEHFAVRRKFRHFYQRQSAQRSKEKQDRNISVLWNLLEEAEQQSTNTEK